MKTLYELLGTSPDATQAQIEQGYKRRLDRYLARQRIGKPDHQTRQMRAVREAYLLLSSPQRRQAYDQQLKADRENRLQGRNPAYLIPAAAVVMAVVLALGAVAYLHRTSSAHARASAAREQSYDAGPSAARQLLGAQGAALRTN